MTLLSTIRADSLAARKSKSPSSSVLTTLLGEVDKEAKRLDPARPLTDDEVLAVVRKFLKNLAQTISHLQGSGSTDALEKANTEREALEVYLPKQLTEDELEAIVRPKIAAGENMGVIMKSLKAEYAGRFDGQLASSIVKRELAS